jgi:hypothetical protein
MNIEESSPPMSSPFMIEIIKEDVLGSIGE